MPPGGFYGKAGMMDYIGVYSGVPFAIEVKRDGEEPTELQFKRLRDFDKAGGIAAVIKGKDYNRLEAIVRAIMGRAVKNDAI
jgi:hypothetical protein